jgi:hypothetical protein
MLLSSTIQTITVSYGVSPYQFFTKNKEFADFYRRSEFHLSRRQVNDIILTQQKATLFFKTAEKKNEDEICFQTGKNYI